MTDPRQLTFDELIEQAAEETLAEAQVVSSTAAYRCPGCGEWCYDQRKQKVCGVCGRRFVTAQEGEG